MCAVEIGVLIDHLELDPNTELHAARLDLLREPVNPIRQTVGVDRPVTEPRMIRRARTEPAVIEHEELHAALCRHIRDGEQLLLRKVEVGRLPVVDEDGAHLVAPCAACQPPLVEAVIRAAHAVQPLVRPDEHRLRRLERLARGERPVKIRAVDARLQACHTVVVHLGEHLEVAAVDKAHGEHLALHLRRLGAHESDEGIVLSRGVSAADRRDARGERTSLHVTLTCPRPRQLQPLVVRIGQVNRETHHLLQVQHLHPRIVAAHTARDRISLGKDRVEELHAQPRRHILQRDDERLRLAWRLHVGGGQPRELRLAVLHAPVLKLQIENAAAVLLQHIQRRATKIRRAIGRQLLTDRVERVVAAVRKDTRRHPAMRTLKEMLEALAVAECRTEVKAPEPAVRQYHENVADRIIEEMKDSALLMIDDIHVYPPSVV